MQLSAEVSPEDSQQTTLTTSDQRLRERAAGAKVLVVEDVREAE